LKELALLFTTETKPREPSSAPCRWSVAGDTARQQTLSSGTRRKLLCSPAQVASYSSLLEAVSHSSSFHDNFKEGNVIFREIYEDAKS